jgi:glycosyltransferase involved in cell wall biosynthesis
MVKNKAFSHLSPVMRSNAKIWIITYHFGSVKAGPVIRFLRYAPYFKEHGRSITFVTKDREEGNNETNGINTLYLPCKDNIELTKLAIRKALIEKEKPDYLVFFALEHWALPHFVLARLKGIRLLYVSTMQFDLKYKEYGTSRGFFARSVLAFVLHILYRTMNLITCSTQIFKQDFKKIGVPTKKISVIYNGVDIQRFKPVSPAEKSKLRQKLGLPINTLLFLYVGLFVERKGVDYLLELWSALEKIPSASNAVLLMAGDEMLDINENSPGFKKNWPLLKANSSYNGSVIFKPFSHEINELYQAADVFVFPSRLEGMPNVLLEAMASGLPVLVNRFKGFSEDYGNPGEHYLLMSGDVVKDVEVIKKLVDNEEFRKELSVNARNHACRKFALEKSIRDYLEILS